MAAVVNAPAPPVVAPPTTPVDPIRQSIADGIRDGDYNYIEAYEKDHLGRLRPSQGSSSYSRSRSRSYDYTGMDKAHEISQQAAAGDGALYDAAMKDPLSIPGLTERIGQMQRYVNAYKSGQDLPDQVVLPARRLASESDSFSRSISRGVTRDKLGGSEKAIRPSDKRSGGADAEAADKPAQFEDSPPPAGPPAEPPPPGLAMAKDAGFGPQGPPMPGLGGTDKAPIDDVLPDPGGDDIDGRHGIPSLPQAKLRQDDRITDKMRMAEDPTALLRRIQEEMGLV